MMKLTEIEQQFESVAVIRGSVFLLQSADAIRFVEECEKQGVDILGIEGFRVFGERLQPQQEHSFDLEGDTTNNHKIAKDFLQERLDKAFWFEVVADDGSDS